MHHSEFHDEISCSPAPCHQGSNSLLCPVCPGCTRAVYMLYTCCTHAHPLVTEQPPQLPDRLAEREREKERERERDCIHITFITGQCYNCSISLLVIVSLLLCPIYKLNFIIGMYVYIEKVAHIECGTICSFRNPLGVLGCVLHG